MATAAQKRKTKKKSSGSNSIQVIVSPFALPGAAMAKVAVKGKKPKLVLPQHSGQSFDNRTSHGNLPKWPIKSCRGGCNPAQVAAANARLAAKGETGFRYAPDGDVIWDGPGARRRYLRDTQQYDRSGYYD